MARISSLTVALVISAFAGLPSGPTAAQTPHTHQHTFEDADKWAKVFDDPERDAWQKPHEVIRALALKPDAVVADIGAGTGYFEKRLAEGVGPEGRVLAIDVEPDMIRYLGEADPTTRRLIEEVLAVEEEHADDLVSLIEDVGKQHRV